MEQVHVLADHGAWMLYLAGGAYRILPSIHWLLASQALALSCTALPVWWLAKQAGLGTSAVLAGLRPLVAAAGGVQRCSV